MENNDGYKLNGCGGLGFGSLCFPSVPATPPK